MSEEIEGTAAEEIEGAAEAAEAAADEAAEAAESAADEAAEAEGAPAEAADADAQAADGDADDDYELVELELSEDDIVRYLEDEAGNRIGFVIMEDGEEAEYLYVEEDDGEGEAGDAAGAPADPDDIGDLGITRDGVQAATDDMNAVFKDGVAVAAELKGAFDDIKGALDFTSFLK